MAARAHDAAAPRGALHRRGAREPARRLALLLYLAEGAAGLPVFAGVAGVAYMLGTTGGYLVSYPVAAGLVGWLAERGWDRRLAWTMAAMTLGLLVIYAFGVAWLAGFLDDFGAVLVQGMLIFIPGDLIKIAIAALALPGGWALARRSHERLRSGE